MNARGRRALAVVVLVAVGAGGCGGPGGGAATSNDVACAAVLPLARDIVHGRGDLVLIRRIDGPDADTLSREAGVVPAPPPRPRPKLVPPPEPTNGPPAPKTCLVVYHGSYPPGTIAGATAPAVGGDYALLVLRVRHPAVDRILVTPALPADAVKRPWWRFWA